MSASSLLSKTVATEQNIQKLNHTSTNLSGTADGLKRMLKQLDADIKEDKKGVKEYEEYLTKLNIQRATLAERIATNKAWIDAFEANSSDGAFEAQYKRLLEEIQKIYETAKEFHGKGIEMLIKEFNYHIAYKRWNDTFTAVPFKPA